MPIDHVRVKGRGAPVMLWAPLLDVCAASPSELATAKAEAEAKAKAKAEAEAEAEAEAARGARRVCIRSLLGAPV